MAVEFNTVKMLLWAKNLGVSFEKTLTLGHQGLECSPDRFRRALRDFGLPVTQEEIKRCFHRPTMGPLFADEFFRFLGAKEIAVVDRSDFEGANLLHDLNEPFSESHRGRYSVVFDGGTLEHIFNYSAALRHCMELVRPGGHFITITPANNYMGHGFYQLSPELFFRVFSADNGFVLSKIIIFNASKTDAAFYQVTDPAIAGSRNNLISSHSMLLAILAQRVALTSILAHSPMQSDYVAGWENFRRSQTNSTPAYLGLLKRLRVALNPYWPYWLLHWKRALVSAWNREPSRLSNRRHFQKLGHRQICGERVSPAKPGNEN
ncbi:MAG: hypothetical protein HOP33_23460 [Verrucomicrobia bacterium]|nr:hypothetical protein [Verrucomicrobiota bacterium]